MMNEILQVIEAEKQEEKRKAEEEARRVKRRARKRKITRHCCNECGQPKHYMCLEHNGQGMVRRNKLFKLRTKIRYHSRKLLFNFARNLGFDV